MPSDIIAVSQGRSLFKAIFGLPVAAILSATLAFLWVRSPVSCTSSNRPGKLRLVLKRKKSAWQCGRLAAGACQPRPNFKQAWF